MNQNKKVAVIGVGMVGGALQRYFEKKGFQQGKDLFLYDKGRGLGGPEQVNQADIIFVAVPTPFRKDGKGPAPNRACSGSGPAQYRTSGASSGAGFDLSCVEEAISNIKGNKIIVIKSTVLPGTTEYFQQKYPEHKILFNPEFLTELTADQDMSYPDRQIVGFTKQSYNVSGDVMRLLPLAPFERIMPATEAELVKYFGNNWFAVKVIYANEVYKLCQKLGVDYDKVKEAAAADKRIGPSHLDVFHKGYRGFGGKCLVKDIRAMIQFADSKGVDLKLHKITEAVNNELMKQQGIDDPEKFSKRD